MIRMPSVCRAARHNTGVCEGFRHSVLDVVDSGHRGLGGNGCECRSCRIRAGDVVKEFSKRGAAED